MTSIQTSSGAAGGCTKGMYPPAGQPAQGAHQALKPSTLLWSGRPEEGTLDMGRSASSGHPQPWGHLAALALPPMQTYIVIRDLCKGTTSWP